MKLQNAIKILVVIGLFQTKVFASSTQSDISGAEKIVVDFYQKIFVERADSNKVRQVSEQYLHPSYIQHNPYVATGRDAFIKAVGSWMENKPTSAKTEIKKVISSGDYIVLHMHSYDETKPGSGKAGVDIFRVENGKIMEHWDIWQKIPANMPHENGMF